MKKPVSRISGWATAGMLSPNRSRKRLFVGFSWILGVCSQWASRIVGTGEQAFQNPWTSTSRLAGGRAHEHFDPATCRGLKRGDGVEAVIADAEAAVVGHRVLNGAAFFVGQRFQGEGGRPGVSMSMKLVMLPATAARDSL